MSTKAKPVESEVSKKKKEKKKPVQEEAPKQKAPNASISNLKPFSNTKDDAPFETVTGQKKEKKQKQRKDSLDDYTSGSDSEDIDVMKKNMAEKKKISVTQAGDIAKVKAEEKKQAELE